jgi:hypothetical protein
MSRIGDARRLPHSGLNFARIFGNSVTTAAAELFDTIARL